ncbi:uncharacterized protein J4E88_009554 [Alternaria novae-zelandiae]|uniref:uncharacterized protein n=1 Tax=Alternaria novae-zelandiae TaxID=430562 RepID=UPI0020C2B030|nr:uncharacterized protein J4E88_009554 [Alternaria novae-zelandiae]KAI4670802.1 hypothetical protein J4E88_009554 [Alternaria novae-zelandiae]
MSDLRRRAQKTRVMDTSDSSSQASEDNSPPAKIDPKANRFREHYAAMNPDRPSAETNGRYGMFSQVDPRLPPPATPSKTVAKRKRATMDKTGSNKKSGMKDMSGEREQSPLFEPESDGQQDADTVMLSPPSTPSANVRLPSRKKGKSTATPLSTVFALGRRRHRPIVIESGSSGSDSDSDSDSDTNSNIVVATEDNLTIKATKDLIATSAMPGDVSVVDEYISILKDIVTHSSETAKHSQVIETLAEEEATISLALDGLADEEEQEYADIAQACALCIKDDMAEPDIAADFIAIQASIEKRNKEAEVARQAVPEIMAKRKEELEAQKFQARYKREALEEERTDSDWEKLQEKKSELENRGGMAMGFELGKRLAK